MSWRQGELSKHNLNWFFTKLAGTGGGAHRLHGCSTGWMLGRVADLLTHGVVSRPCYDKSSWLTNADWQLTGCQHPLSSAESHFTKPETRWKFKTWDSVIVGTLLKSGKSHFFQPGLLHCSNVLNLFIVNYSIGSYSSVKYLIMVWE